MTSRPRPARRILPARLQLQACIATCALTAGGAQQPAPGVTPWMFSCASEQTAGSPAERTALVAALAVGQPLATTLRPLGARRGDSAIARAASPDSTPRCSSLFRPTLVSVWYNTTRARADRDGVAWQGRGATIATTGGAIARYGPLRVAVRPVVSLSQNRAYTPAPTSPPQGDFRDPFWGGSIDLPYRFGGRVHGIVDPGESGIDVTYGHAAVGASTAAQHWGPAHRYPLVLATEGAAYPRVFARARQLPVYIGDVTAEWQYGWLEASAYSGLEPGQRSRLLSAFTGSLRPRGYRTIELGASRLFHVRRQGSLFDGSVATLPFGGILKQNSSDVDFGGYNQLASVFARFAPARHGIEVYGEYYREDHNLDLRDVAVELDHQSAYVIGVRRAWTSGAEVQAVTIERANGRISHLARLRGQTPIYIHGDVREGHTYRGQPLGSVALLGGSGLHASWARISAADSWHVAAEIATGPQNSEGGSWNGRYSQHYSIDVLHERGVGGDRYAFGVGLQTSTGVVRFTNLTLHSRWSP